MCFDPSELGSSGIQVKRPAKPDRLESKTLKTAVTNQRTLQTNRLYFFPLLLARCPIAERADSRILGDHSALAPPLPIPNRTVKQRCADDSAVIPVRK